MAPQLSQCTVVAIATATAPRNAPAARNWSPVTPSAAFPVIAPTPTRTIAVDKQADDVRLSRLREALPLGVGQIERAADVEVRPLLRLRRLAVGLDQFGRVEVPERPAGVEQVLHGLGIELPALRLEVRSVWSADFGPFVPVKSQPPEGVQDGRQCGVDIPLLVGVVDAEDELAAVVPRPEPVEQGGAHAADVHVASG